MECIIISTVTQWLLRDGNALLLLVERSVILLLPVSLRLLTEEGELCLVALDIAVLSLSMLCWVEDVGRSDFDAGSSL
jgi:hypothetical protein